MLFDFAHYETIFVTESIEDPAVPVIRELIKNKNNARFVVAGLSSDCAQKNYNLLAGIAATHDTDMYVFADSDVRPHRQWLRELILPFGNPAIAVTTGFRWLNPTKGNPAEWMHAYANIFIYIVFSCAFFVGGVGLWGGSMAIRRKDFERLAVAKTWSAAVVDDLSLSRIIRKNRLKGIMVPTCMAHSDELLPTVTSGVLWFRRQIMFLRTYFKHLWFFLALPVTLLGTLFTCLLPVAFLVSIFKINPFFASGGGAALVFYIGELMTALLYPLMGPCRGSTDSCFFSRSFGRPRQSATSAPIPRIRSHGRACDIASDFSAI